MKNSPVEMIPIERIKIINPRFRDRKKFDAIIQSIRNLGMKKPIKVAVRGSNGDTSYELVCGQGRIEACQALGYTEIPAIVVEATKEDSLLMSLVENMARLPSKPLDLIREIERLKERGHTNAAISRKLDITEKMVHGLLALSGSGEDRLLDAAIKGLIPLGVAIDIAKTDGVESQKELLNAYENKQLNQVSIRTVKRLIEQRR
ncbi:MAG: ParB/RepB/Spo0J family partition protein, partial [Terrimicrobiaceae bacterium]